MFSYSVFFLLFVASSGQVPNLRQNSGVRPNLPGPSLQDEGTGLIHFQELSPVSNSVALDSRGKR